jgi:hypothetical protein
MERIGTDRREMDPVRRENREVSDGRDMHDHDEPE